VLTSARCSSSFALAKLTSELANYQSSKLTFRLAVPTTAFHHFVSDGLCICILQHKSQTNATSIDCFKQPLKTHYFHLHCTYIEQVHFIRLHQIHEMWTIAIDDHVIWLRYTNTAEELEVVFGEETLGDPMNIRLESQFLHGINTAFTKLL